MIPHIDIGSVLHLESNVAYAINTTTLHPCACLLNNHRNYHSGRQNKNLKPNPRNHTPNFDNSNVHNNMASVSNCKKSIESLDVNQNNINDEIHVTAVIESTPFELKVDSGASATSFLHQLSSLYHFVRSHS